MAHDKLEDFILNHRADFDDAPAPPGLWDRIEAALPEDDKDDDGFDPLVDFVATHRDAFDDATPPPRLAESVFGQLRAQDDAQRPRLRAVGGRARTLRILGIAASFLLLLSAAFVVGSQRGYRAAEDERMAAELREISPKLAETEAYYQSEIAAQFTRVDQLNDDPQLRADLAAIDEATAEIRANLLDVPVSQRADLVDRLIENYRTKLDILLKIQRHVSPSSPSTTQQPTDEL